VAQRFLGGAADLRIAAVCRCDTQHGFELRLNNLQFAEKLQFAQKTTFRIRASLQRCRKLFEIRRPFRGWISTTGFFSNCLSG